MKELSEKLDALRTLVALYTQHLKHHNSSEVTVEGNMIKITYYNDNKGLWWTFESILFPISDIDKRIVHYKNKLDNISKIHSKDR